MGQRLGIPISGNLINCTGYQIGNLSGFGTGIATFLATPSSANLRSALTDETGNGAAYFAGGALGTPASGDLSNCTGVTLSKLTASLGADVALNNTANYFDGPSIAQGASGVWFVSGTVTVRDTAGPAGMFGKLWDGTTIIATARTDTSAANFYSTISLSGYITNPAGNLRISVRDASSTSGIMIFNATGNSLDSTISAIRVG